MREDILHLSREQLLNFWKMIKLLMLPTIISLEAEVVKYNLFKFTEVHRLGERERESKTSEDH